MWARGRVWVEECPTSTVTPKSVEWLEKFWAWKLAGAGELMALNARDADAFLILEQEWRESRNGG